MSEKTVVLGQVDELMAEGIEDAEDALELAMVVGLAARLEATDSELHAVNAWREAWGADLLDEAWEDVELSNYTDAIDALLDGSATDEQIQEAIFSWDELVAGAVWNGHADSLVSTSAEIAQTIRQCKETFSGLKDYAARLLENPLISGNPAVYDFWFALAE